MGYLGKQPALQASEYREEFNITSTTTNIITSGFVRTGSSNYLEVYRNGVLLGKADYTLQSDYKTIVLTNAAVAGDIVVVLGRRNLTQGLKVAERRHEHVIQNGETTVTFPFPLTADITDVYINGVKLWYGDGSGDGSNSDYAINPVTRVISFGLNPSVGDTVSIVSREPTSVSSTPLPLIDSNGASVISENGGVISLSADTAVIEGSSSGDLVRITQTGTGNALVVEDETNPDSTPFVVSPDGKVFIGSNTSITSFFGSPPSKFAVSGVASPLIIESFGNNVFGSRIDLLKTRGTTSNSKTIINNGDTLGEIFFGGTDGTSAIPAASIKGLVDGIPGTNDMPGRLAFYTTTDGTSSLSERMRIDSSGNLLVGNTSAPTGIANSIVPLGNVNSGGIVGSSILIRTYQSPVDSGTYTIALTGIVISVCLEVWISGGFNTLNREGYAVYKVICNRPTTSVTTITVQAPTNVSGGTFTSGFSFSASKPDTNTLNISIVKPSGAVYYVSFNGNTFNLSGISTSFV